MDRIIDSQIEDLKKMTIEMGGLVEKAFASVVSGLLKREAYQFAEVHRIEQAINDLQIKIDNECLQVLAKQGPVAKDLRLILSIIKINTDLERMGDQCVNVAYIGRELVERGFSQSMNDLEQMSGATTIMVKTALDSFVKMDVVIAESVLGMDDLVDQLRSKINRSSIEAMKTDTANLQTHLDFLLIARNFERMGDHSTNIAEDVIFALSGKDIRHGTNDQ